MTRDPESEQLSITVATLHGQKFTNMDTTSRPFGDGNMTVVSFWETEDTLCVLPMSEVKYVKLKILKD